MDYFLQCRITETYCCCSMIKHFLNVSTFAVQVNFFLYLFCWLMSYSRFSCIECRRYQNDFWKKYIFGLSNISLCIKESSILNIRTTIVTGNIKHHSNNDKIPTNYYCAQLHGFWLGWKFILGSLHISTHIFSYHYHLPVIASSG